MTDEEKMLDACRNSYISGYYIGKNDAAEKIYRKAKELYLENVSLVVAFNQLLDWIKTEYELEVHNDD